MPDQVHTTSTPRTWSAKDVGETASTSTYGDRAPFRFGGGWRSHEERIEARHTSSLPSFGPHGCVKPYCCFVDCIVFLLGSVECYSTHKLLTRPSVSVPLPPYVAHGPPFICSRGHRQVAT